MRNLSIIINSVVVFLHLAFVLIFFKGNKQKLVKEGRRLRNYFEQTGGIFVKFGQIISLRVDLIPYEICFELKNLLDSLPSFPYSEVEKIIAKDFKKEVNQVFKSFERSPLASASIGQVHKAELNNGEEVVVKISNLVGPLIFQ